MIFSQSELFNGFSSGLNLTHSKNTLIAGVKQRLLNSLVFGSSQDDAINQVTNITENLVALYFSLRDCTTKRQALSVIFLYFKTHYNSSVVISLKEYLVDSELFSSYDVEHYDASDYDESLDTQGALDIDWFNLLTNCQKNWSVARNAPAFKKLSKLISMFAALGLCELSHFNVDFRGIRIFSIGAYQKHVNASDIIGAILDTVTFFAEGAYRFFETGDYSAFLYTDADAVQFEDDYFRILELSNFVRCGNLEKFTNGNFTESDYDCLLTKNIELGKKIMSGLRGPERTVFSTKYEKLRKLNADYIQYRTTGKLRIAPYGIYIHGNSSVGKSYISALLMRYTLKANGYNADDDRIITMDDADKFVSNAKSFVTGILLDDVGNTMHEFVETAPTQKMINLLNNVPHYANMAEVDQKGKVALEPKVVVMTSNITCDRVAGMYSNDVMSIIRRSQIHITVEVKPEFRKNGKQLDSNKVRKAFGDDPYPDVWDFSCFIADNADSSNGRGELKPLFPKPVDIYTLIKYIANDSKNHFENQRFVIESSSDLASRLELCDMCSLPQTMCKCQQFGVSIPDDIKDTLNWMLNNKILSTLFCLSDNKFYSNKVSMIIAFLQRKNIWYGGKTFRDWGHLSFLTSCLCISFCPIFGIMCFFTAISNYWASFYVYYKLELERISKIRGTVRQLFSSVRAKRAAQFFGSFLLITLLYKLVKQFYTFWKMQGNIVSPTPEDVKRRDAEANPWVGAYVSPVPQNLQVDCDSKQLTNVVETNLCYVRFPDHPDGVAMCNMLFIKSNLAIIPQHMWYADTMKFEAYHTKRWVRSEEDYAAFLRGRGVISKLNCYMIPNSDLCIVYIPGCGTWKNITKFFPDAKVGANPATMVHRSGSGDITRFSTHIKPSDSIKVKHLCYSGHTYEIKEGTFNGLCTGTLVSETKPAVIAGFHLAGNGIKGASGFITKNDVTKAESYLKNLVSVLPAHDDGPFPHQQCGVAVLTSTAVHSKSCVNHVPTSGVLNVYGSCLGKASTRSEVIDTPISKDIADVCGVENQWGPPKMHPWKPYSVNLENTTDPSPGLEGWDLEWAARDYVNPLIDLVKSEPWCSDVKPLTEIQTVSGIDGKRFVDAMVSKTAIGYPLTGPKRNFQVALDPEDHPDTSCPVIFTEQIMDEVKRLEEAYLRSERGYPIFKASLKDEPTKLTKDKVRVFFGAPTPLQFLVRKYYLPILRMLSMNPLLAECAVGINSQGPEWDQLARHMKQHGEDRIFAGDYKAYDTRMPAQLTSAAYNVLIKIAEHSGNYSDDDITIMRGIATDCCYPFVAFNGDLISFNGVHVSGINVTAYVGCIMNSLLQRSAYSYLCGKNGVSPQKYRDVVAVVNYGDDFKGSVSVEADFFNFISYQTYLREHGITLTMPDKESVAKKYMTDNEADFLKRHNVYCSELDQIMGALDKSSIFKSLHCVLKSSSVTPMMQSTMNIDGALREMFFHGKDDYEQLREQLKEVARRNDIRGCLMLDVPYEDEMKRYKEKYYGFSDDTIELDESDIEFEMQSGFESKSYAISKYARKHANDDTAKKTAKGYKFAYEDSTVKIVRRHKSSTNFDGLETLPTFFSVVKNDRTKNILELMHQMKHAPCLYETRLAGFPIVGDVDIAFYLGGKNEFAVFECKKTFHPGLQCKNKKQVRKVVDHLAAYNKNAIFHGFLLQGDEIKHIKSSAPPSKKLSKTELFSTYSC